MNTFNRDQESSNQNESSLEKYLATAEKNATLEHRKYYRDLVLRDLIQKNEPLRDMAAEAMLKSDPDGADLFIIMYDAPSFRERAWELMINSKKVHNHALRTVMINLPEYSEQAARLQMQRNPSPLDLAIIIDAVPSCAAEAWPMLLAKELEIGDLQLIVHHAPACEEWAQKLLDGMKKADGE